MPTEPNSVSDEIVRELQHAIGVAQHTPPERLHPVDVWVRASRERLKPQPSHAQRTDWRGLFSLIPWVLGAGAVIAGLLYVAQYGTGVKERVVRQGNAAIGYLVSAKDDLEALNLDSARDNLVQAQAAFEQASDEINIIGKTFITIVSRVPGMSSLRTGRDLLKAGQLFSDAGVVLSDVFQDMGNSGGLLSALPSQDELTMAKNKIVAAADIINTIDPNTVPDEDREKFESLRGQLPTILALADRAVNTASFLASMTGTEQPKRYLVLFSNSSELRPTGGFPGSYGLLTFDHGQIKDFHADDIYNPDGQITELVVPPLQLQHITPSWGMRDAAWWIDFPTSAKKVMEYWQLSGGSAVDGIISIKPDILRGILRITGPISLPQYDLVLSADNVIEQLQLEVESNQEAAQPKQIIVDLAPKILQRLSSAPASQLAQVLQLFKEGLDTRDILVYFSDEQLERFASDERWDGAVQQTDGDYLAVNVSNIKGAKADAVTDTSLKLESWLESGAMVHRLTITRRHNGGSSAYGFYNKTNYSYIRILAPEGSMLRAISGNDKPNNKPLVNYAAEDVRRDPDLEALESTYRTGIGGAMVYTESEKTGFGFWMKVQPGNTQSVQLEYEVPVKYIGNDYNLYVQHQPGLPISDFEFVLQKQGSLAVLTSDVPLTPWPDSWRLHSDLSHDLELAIQLE